MSANHSLRRLVPVALTLTIACALGACKKDEAAADAAAVTLRVAATQDHLSPDADFGTLANLLLCYVIGRWQQYAKSGFVREPLADWAAQWPMLLVACLNQRSA